MKKIKPGSGQESVWDYPRPPAIEKVSVHIRVVLLGKIIYDHNAAYRILETSHPPTYYLPMDFFENCEILETDKTSFCEYKGMATYCHIKVDSRQIDFPAWGYPHPNSNYAALEGHISIYAHRMDECFIDDEKVQAQEGDFYGGWITSKVVGPFKGGPGTWGW